MARDFRSGAPNGIGGQVRITSSRLNLRVAEQFADERQSLAERKRLRGICVAQIVYADIVEAGEFSDSAPGFCKSVTCPPSFEPVTT